MTLTNGEVLNLGKNPRSPPTGLQLFKKVKTDSITTTICHYNGYTYVGQTSGAIDRIDEHGNVDKAFIKLPNMVVSSAIDNERIYILTYVDTASSRIFVHELNNHKQLISWQHCKVSHFGQRILVTHDSKLAVGDWSSKQIIIYSLTGDVIRKVPCPPSLTLTGNVSMSSCGDDSVVISDWGTANMVVRMSLKDGSLLWSSDRFTDPGGIVHHPAGYVLVASSSTEKTEISILDEENGGS